ncbi:hypothetical protein [Mastigocoleus sp. MO_188.B34]|uniref:hypothetical protein n=1 Tax=Mastigocoleus sp. MO_188.B34 TaxID=3036635 RepID=UPI00262DF045|nr:hypothetical protein [Mastigocoleus sp. MO_188.B34]
MLPVLAASPAPGTVIDNQATGSFTDPSDGTEKQIESNTVTVTVAEVAGITITQAAVPEEAPSGVSGAGANQGNNEINPDDIIYFTYKITNVGNDPTQFFIPGIPSNVTNGSLNGNIEIIEYDPDGSGATAAVDLSGSPVSIPNSGISTGDAAALDLPNGSIPPDGTVTIRVPIKADSNLSDGDTVTVVMGDTGSNDNSAATQNQVYAAGTNDVYTQDNPDNTTGETDGTPINGDATNHRQEASYSQDVTVAIAVSSNPNVLLVKRITAVNGNTTTNNGDDLSGYINEQDNLNTGGNPYDDNTITVPDPASDTDPQKDTDKWPDPNTFLIGGINGGQVDPEDEIEYTIYFLSAGDTEAKSVLFCDRVPTNTTFIPTAFNGETNKATGGLDTADRGIIWQYNNIIQSLTNVKDGDAGQYFAPGVDPKTVYPDIDCGGDNTNGAVVVNLGDIPNATAPGVPINSYGFVRFRGKVE